jgi:tight adherence protein B
MDLLPELTLILVPLLVALAITLTGYELINAASRYYGKIKVRERLAPSGCNDSCNNDKHSEKAGNKGNAIRDLCQLLTNDLCCNGIPLLRKPAKMLMRISVIRQNCASVARHIAANHTAGNQQQVKASSVCEILLALGGASALLVQLLFSQFLFTLCALALPFFLAARMAAKWQAKQIIALREQLPEALNAIGMCFQAGYSLQQALQQTASECPKPLSVQLARAANDILAGCSVAEALSAMETRCGLPDVRFITTALEIQHSTGGSLKDILASASQSINASFELSRSLEVQTAQARLSARVVSIMPIALVCVLSLTMEGYLESFFSSTAGFIVLVSAIAMELMGILIIRRILALELG